MAQQLDWDPAIADQEVRIRSNPGRRGTTTGKTRTMGTTTLVQIQFGPNERSYKPYPLLELCGEPEDIESLLAQARFGGPDDLRRILTFEKVKGHLTNIFYSMEVSNTDFYAHQFKPVAKFIESPVGRILIADEVGLGKTVEAIYIWKELQARADARRLLIVCPAILREKWQSDLRARFNLFADIVSAKQLLEKLNGVRESNTSQSFIAITSLEGLRPSNDWESGSGKSARAEFARLLDSTPATDEFGLLDLVIIDEAHYLRNPSTANHRLGHLLRDAARHMILLTATPIQINSDNLYQLLRLISPEDFFNAEIFQDMLQANEPVVRALRSLWQQPPDIADAQNAVATALKSKYFRENPVFQRLQEQLSHAENLDVSMRASLGFQLENSSLLSQYLTRSRKRDVLPNRVKRSPQSLTVKFSPLEQEIYDQVSSTIRQRAKDKKGGALFSLISRQRQMASSMAAALETWRREGVLSEFNAESNWAESSWEAEQQWQDFGRGMAIDSDSAGQAPRAAELFDFSNLDLKVLEQQDSKYQELVKFLQDKIAAEPGAKFVIFAYFRGTLEYLQRRLKQDGIDNCLILGGQGDDKWANIRTFEETDVPILLSSEVGSEGIDLQFCRFLINYDLPWNPMRVEQRIGRLDRLGQKAERISVINFSLVDTIEEKILERLYERIEIFRESVGDLENILGGMTEQLMLELLQPGLSKREQEKKVEQTADAILKQRHQQNQLEQEAINMVAFSDHILTSIDRDRQQGRWLQPQELQAFVNDFFAQHYPGTLIEPQSNQTFDIHLATEAQNDLAFFIQGKRFPNATRLSSLKVNCFFEPKRIKEMGKGKNRQSELLDPTHPLIAWIQHCYEQEANAFYPIAASQISSQTVDQPPGLYFYLIHRWSFSGLRSSKRLAYQALQLSPTQTPKQLSPEASETLVNQLMLRGQPQPNAANLLEDWQAVQAAFTLCDEQLEDQFFQAMEDFRAENENRCNVQERNARDYAQRRRQMLEERLQRFQEQGQTRIIPATEGQLAKLERELAVKLKTVNERRNIEDQMLQLAAGLVWITEAS